MSHEPVPVIDGKLTYDFRIQQSYINDPFQSGSFFGQKEVRDGVFVMFAGNGEQSNTATDDTDITASDYVKWLNIGPFKRFYNIEDYNMDGDVSAADYYLWLTNSNVRTSVNRD
jgi:hypothetical protein